LQAICAKADPACRLAARLSLSHSRLQLAAPALGYHGGGHGSEESESAVF